MADNINPEPTKVCSRCKETLPLSRFAVRKDTGGCRSQCKTCNGKASMESRARHPKPLTEAQLENRREYLRKYGRDNNHRWEAAIAASHKRWRAANREHLIAQSKAWNEAHPDAYQRNKNVNNQKRRAQKAGSDEHYTAEEFDALKAQYDNVCLCCGEAKPLTADHIIPLSKNGSNGIDNIQPLCRECNSRKGTRKTDYRP